MYELNYVNDLHYELRARLHPSLRQGIRIVTRGAYLAQVLWPMPSQERRGQAGPALPSDRPSGASDDDGDRFPLSFSDHSRFSGDNHIQRRQGRSNTWREHDGIHGGLTTPPSNDEERRAMSLAGTSDRSAAAVGDDHTSAEMVAGRLTTELTRERRRMHPCVSVSFPKLRQS